MSNTKVYIGWLAAIAFGLIFFAFMSGMLPLVSDRFPPQIGIPLGVLLGLVACGLAIYVERRLGRRK